MPTPIETLQQQIIDLSAAHSCEAFIKDELLGICINNVHASAKLFLQGAHVTHFQPHDKPNLLWISSEVEYKTGKAIRGGVPICWPWFGDLARNPAVVQQQYATTDLPAHGSARSHHWQLASIETLDNAATALTLVIMSDELSDIPMPSGIALSLRVIIGPELSLELTCSNQSSDEFSYSNALHTYLPIEDLSNVQVRGLEDCRYIDTLQNWQENTQVGPLQIAGETDRIYLGDIGNLIVEDASRHLQLKSNSHSLVAWNPWADKAERLSAFGNQDYWQMLCLETAQIMDDCISLRPGESHTCRMELNLLAK